MRVKDLPDQPRYNQYLYCTQCGEHNSAARGDYFMADPDTVIRCCRRPMQLVQERTTRTPLRKGRG